MAHQWIRLDTNLPTHDKIMRLTSSGNYRAAFAANHNYVAAISGANPPTVALGLAAVVAAVNRVNEVYENDLSIHMSLVPNNDLVIYPDALTDPYSNGGGALNQNTANLNAVIGSANYDGVFAVPVTRAVNVEVTGRTILKGRQVRVKITFVGDGEPDTVHGGLMTVPW